MPNVATLLCIIAYIEIHLHKHIFRHLHVMDCMCRLLLRIVDLGIYILMIYKTHTYIHVQLDRHLSLSLNNILNQPFDTNSWTTNNDLVANWYQLLPILTLTICWSSLALDRFLADIKKSLRQCMNLNILNLILP